MQLRGDSDTYKPAIFIIFCSFTLSFQVWPQVRWVAAWLGHYPQ
uniref:Uncharacterized protein n=1 Tax=Rhizophora mucronata TaxID=61149 RepID=A0A2P2N8G6_RHIMU